MNQQLQKTLQLADHPCLTNITGLYSYPFTRSASVLEGYEFKPGPWMVLLSNMRPVEVTEDDPGTRKALIQFCPFCGAPLYPEPDPGKALGVELVKEVPHVPEAADFTVQTAAKSPARKS